jgi:short-subunit dehydrogenase
MAKRKESAVWITGASSGIGKEAVKEFARSGHKVIVSARRVTELERLAKELNEEGIEIYLFPCNVASAANVDQTIKKINETFLIDCLINNAGITSFKPAVDNSTNEIENIINTNLLGSIYTIKYLLPHMISNGGGTIINISSFATKKIFTNSSAYTASKMGLIGYSNVLREEVREHNIRVINVIPGATETPMWSTEIRKQSGEKMMVPSDIARVLVSAYLQKGNMVSEEIVIRPIHGDI